MHKKKFALATLFLSLSMPLVNAATASPEMGQDPEATLSPTPYEFALQKMDAKRKIAEQIAKDVPVPAKTK